MEDKEVAFNVLQPEQGQDPIRFEVYDQGLLWLRSRRNAADSVSFFICKLLWNDDRNIGELSSNVHDCFPGGDNDSRPEEEKADGYATNAIIDVDLSSLGLAVRHMKLKLGETRTNQQDSNVRDMELLSITVAPSLVKNYDVVFKNYCTMSQERHTVSTRTWTALCTAPFRLIGRGISKLLDYPGHTLAFGTGFGLLFAAGMLGVTPIAVTGLLPVLAVTTATAIAGGILALGLYAAAKWLLQHTCCKPRTYEFIETDFSAEPPATRAAWDCGLRDCLSRLMSTCCGSESLSEAPEDMAPHIGSQ